MENKVLFLDPLDIRPHFKCGAEIGTAMLVGSGISALGGAASGLLGSSSASSNNARMIEYNRWAQKDAQAYNTQMYERQLADQEALYDKYQSPQAIAQQLKAAGINPSALAAGQGFSGGSMPSVPSAGSSPVTSLSGLQNTGAPISDAIQQTAGAIASLTSSYASYSQGKETIDTLDHHIKLLIAQKEGQELLNAYQTTQNFIQDEFGHDKAGAELQEIHSRIFANYCQGNLAEADKECKEMMTKLYQQHWDMNEEQRGALLGKAYAEWQLVNSKIETEKEVAKTEKSKQKVNYAHAAESNARRIGQEFSNIILEGDANNAKSLGLEKLKALESELRKLTWSNDRDRAQAEVELRKLRERIIHYEIYDNSASFDDFWDHFPIIGGIVRGLTK